MTGLLSHADKLRALAATQIGLVARGHLIAAAAAFRELETRVGIADGAVAYWRSRALKAEKLMVDGARELAKMDAPPQPDTPPATEEAPHHGHAI